MLTVHKQETKFTATSAELEWRIEQFKNLTIAFENGQKLVSRLFGVPQVPKLRWQVVVYPNGKETEDIGYVSIFLRQEGMPSGNEPIMAEFSICAYTTNFKPLSLYQDTEDFSKKPEHGTKLKYGYIKSALHADGSLLLRCELKYFIPGMEISVGPTDNEECASEDGDVDDDLCIPESNRKMWESELFTDCLIKVESKEIKAHRCVLGQHSPVFRSMFNNESMVEAREGVIDILDAKYESVRAMVEFMYTGSMSTVDPSSVDEVLAIADKYAVLTLKKRCERLILKTINEKNITSILVLADTYTAALLKKAVLRYFTVNHKNIICTPEWQAMKKDSRELATELLEALLTVRRLEM